MLKPHGLRIEYDDKGEGNRGQLQIGNWKKSGFGEKCHDLNFGHADFKMILRHSNGNVEEVIGCIKLQFRRKA